MDNTEELVVDEAGQRREVEVKNTATKCDDDEQRDLEIGRVPEKTEPVSAGNNLKETMPDMMGTTTKDTDATNQSPGGEKDMTPQQPLIRIPRAFSRMVMALFFILGFLLTARREGCDLSSCGHTNSSIWCSVARFMIRPRGENHSGHDCQGNKGTEDLPPKFYGPPWHGEWEKYIKAPKDKSHILPERIWKVRGNVSTSSSSSSSSSSLGSRDVKPGDDFEEVTAQGRGDGILLGMGGSLTVAFKENIGGRICLDIDSIGAGSEKEGVVTVMLAYSESPWYAGPLPDATTDRQARDLPLRLKLKGGKAGKACVGNDFIRGSFKYFTISVPVPWALDEEGKSTRVDRHWLRIKSLWAVCTAYPAMKGGRNYTGYFYSSNDLLNRIWYAGAWTLQLSTIDPQEGSSLIDYNRLVDGNQSPIGSWYSNFTISNGTSVTTDGAKRDRVVWPGDMFIAVPGIAVSTSDMLSVRNALNVLYDHQYGDGSLPYAGPPMGFHGEFSDTYHLHTLLGTYNYVLYSGDLDYLRSNWTKYLHALEVSISKIDDKGLLHVSSVADWLRPGLTGHNLEASAILYTVLSKSVSLATWLAEDETDHSTLTNYQNLILSWKATQKEIETGLARLYCPATGLFSDNIGLRSCKERYHVDPQDGNSWVLISGLNLSQSNLPFTDPKSSERSATPLPDGVPSAQNISANLVKRWTKFGAPAPEFPNVISPFASGFELLAHCAAGNISAAVELMLLEWGYLLDGPGFTNSTLAEGFRVDGHMQYPAYPSPARNSHAHGWSSGPTSVLMNDVIGIHITKYGGREMIVRSRLPGWMKFVRGGFEFAGGWVEILVWRVGEFVPSSESQSQSQATITSVGDDMEDCEENENPSDRYVQRKDRGQKPLVLPRKSGNRFRTGALRNSKGQEMKKTDGTGIIIRITIPEQTEDGVIQFGGLFEDLWEDELRKGHRGVIFPFGGGDASTEMEDDGLSFGVLSELGPPASQQTRENKNSRSAMYWLRWAKQEVAAPTSADNDESGSESKRKSTKSRYFHHAQNGKLYRAWPEVIPLPAAPKIQTPTGTYHTQPDEAEVDLFRVPVEVEYFVGVKKESESESESGAGEHVKENFEFRNYVLRFDEDYVPLELDTTRPAGVVDWAVMEENFRTPVYEGWNVHHLKAAVGGEEEDLFERVMESGMGMDGDFEYLD